MKRFLTCALCFVSLPAIAVTLYYEQGGACNGLYKTQPLSGCNATQVTHLNVTPMSDTVFDGFKVNGYPIVDANGNIASNAADILRGASLTSDKIQQSYTCQSGFSKNNNGVCVDFSGRIEYVVGDSGDPQSPQNIQPTAADGCWWVYDFDIVFHDRPMDTPPHAVGTFADGLAPSHNSNVTVSHRYGVGFYQGNTKITNIKTPTDNNYMFRGYYGKTFNYLNYNTNGGWPIPITDVITDHTTAQGTVWGARFAVPTGQSYMNLGSPNLKTSYCDMEWIECKKQHPNNTAEYCDSPTPPASTVTVDVYGGWARKCSGDHGDCGIQIYTTPSGAYTAGDVKYNHTCNPGYVPAADDDSNSYLVKCGFAYNTISYSFSKFQVFNGTSLNNITCNNVPQGGTCNLGTTFNLPDYYSPSCGSGNYKLAKWRTNDNIIHNVGDTVQCTTAVLGGQTANITGILCDCNYTSYDLSYYGPICSETCSGR